MASPQKENGYTGTANELIEAICRLEVSGACHRVLRFIERKTYGYNKKEDSISFTQFEKGTGLYRNTINRALEKLLQMGVIEKDKGGYINKFKINKNYEKWTSNQNGTSNQKVYGTSNQKVYGTSNQKGTHKRKKEKKEISELSSHLIKKDMSWKQYNENTHSDYIPSIDVDSGEMVVEVGRDKEANKKVTELIEWAEKVRAKPFMDKPTQRKMVHTLRVNGYNRAQIKETYLELLYSDFWKNQDRLPDFKTVLNSLKNKK